MYFKDFYKEYGNKFTIAYLNFYEDDIIIVYLRIYPTKFKTMFLGAFRIDKLIKRDDITSNEHIVIDDKEIAFHKRYLEKFEVLDFH